MNDWIKKMWYIYTEEFYSTIKKNEIMSFAGKWIELQTIMLSAINQTQKVEGLMFSHKCGTKEEKERRGNEIS